VAVTFDAVGPSSAGASASGASSLSWSHTNNGNALVAGSSANPANDAGWSMTATYAGTAMAAGAIVHSNGGTAGFLRVFTLANPATGANTVAVTVTGGTTELTGGSISMAGAGSFVTQYSATGSVTPATATSVGSTSGGLLAAFVCTGTGVTSATAPSTSRYIDNFSGAGAAGCSAGATSPSTGSNVTTAWTISSDWWAVIGVEVLPGAAPVLAGSAQPGRTWERRYRHPQSPPAVSVVAPAAHAPIFPSQYGGYY
jgi:hypothetical protein